MRRTFLLVIKILLILQVFSQKNTGNESFIPPVNFPIYLSGNFAELRSDHFHSGIDIKTQGVIGKPVFAIDDGYVSRIKVQTNGYGKSVYINHPGGFTSVYGHLDEYNDKIAAYVKRYQYRNQIHTLDIYPGREDLPVKRGDLIAKSGNTGGSSGPHLHFEIRNAGNQHPLNVQKFNFKITDNVDPRIFNFYIYNFQGEGDRRTVQNRYKEGLRLNSKSYSLKTGDTLVVDSPLSFGMEAYDFLNGTHNRCGLYYIKTFVDGDLVYHFQTDEFSFAESRYVNAHIDYALKQLENEKVHRLFRLPNDHLSMYHELKDDGIIKLQPDQVKNIKIVFADIDGNERSVIFYVKGTSSARKKETEKQGQYLEWDKPNSFADESFKLEIPAGSFYEDTWFNYEKQSSGNNLYPWKYRFKNAETPLHLPARLSIKIENIDADLQKYACIVYYDEKGQPSYEAGSLKGNDWMEISTRSLGVYGIEVDTIPPEIIPVNFRKNANLSRNSDIRLVIKDNLSGIKTYEGFIDNKWVLFEYDPKNDLLVYKFDPEVTEKNKNHELEVYVSDDRGNMSVLHSVFTW